jgi:uncharacterized tellurite resistance protein B-like protein
MLDRVRTFVSRLLDPADKTMIDGDGADVAAVALMCHVLAADGMVEEEERAALRRIVATRFGKDEADTDALIAAATAVDREAIDFYGFTSVLKRELDRDARLSLVSTMWDLVYADGGVHELEDNIIWRVAELLGIDQRERMVLKQEAASRQTGRS